MMKFLDDSNKVAALCGVMLLLAMIMQVFQAEDCNSDPNTHWEKTGYHAYSCVRDTP